jgi:hypothetical protein
MNETAPTITPTRTTPTILPEVAPEPGRRLEPMRICPSQVQRVGERVKRELDR